MAKKTRLEKHIEKTWNFAGLAEDLCEAPWRQTERYRCDRQTWISTYRGMLEEAQSAFDEEEWRDAVKNGIEHELVDDYLEVLADYVADQYCEPKEPKGVKEWWPGRKKRRKRLGHVYANIDDSEVYLGQYEDKTAEELREMGYKVED